MTAAGVVDLEPAAVERLRAVLVQAGYTDEGLAVLRGSAGFGLAAFDPAVVARRPVADRSLRDLVTLFMVGGAIRRRRAERLFGKRPCAALEQAGVLEADGDDVRAGIAVDAWEDLLLACDRHDARDAQQVVGMTAAAVTLSHLTVREPDATALDLGTGCGVGALAAARHGASVTATDVNPRALGFVRLNARLNATTGIELAQGDWFAPVAGRAFDLVVSNPPFVVSPDSAFVYRDGTVADDAVSRHVVEQAAAHLRPGGFATVLVNWIRRRDAEPEAPLEWVAGGGCDAIVLRFGLDDPVAYAASWNHGLRPDPAAFEAALDRWLAHYEQLGARAIASGAVVLRRRRDGASHAVALEALEAPTGPAGAQLRRIFAAQERLAGGDDALRAARPRLVEGQALEQTVTVRGGRLDVAGGLAVLDPGAGLALDVDADLAPLLARCDGSVTIGDLLASAPDEARDRHRRALRGLLERGMLDTGDALQ